jgi:divinyl chlorophyllide a 8-vinyl-reductase
MLCHGILTLWIMLLVASASGMRQNIRSRGKFSKPRVMVAGATGYIGRAVVQELVKRQVECVSLIRSEADQIPEFTRKYLEGSELMRVDVLNREEVERAILEYEPTSVVCCLASRDGLGENAFKIDYGGGSNLLKGLEKLNEEKSLNIPPHYVLLSAYCCGKPLLQFQYAKLKLEEELILSAMCSVDEPEGCYDSLEKSSELERYVAKEAVESLTPQKSKVLPYGGGGVTHSIIRPTAYFKSLDGQIEAARKGSPILFFGKGTCSANAISQRDLAAFMVDSAVDPVSARGGMMNTIRNVGGPDVPPLSKKQQANLIYDTLGVPEAERRFISLPLGLIGGLISFFQGVKALSTALNLEGFAQKCEDASEIARIVKYYAEEPMVAIGKDEVHGNDTLRDHFRSVADNGGRLAEVDGYTTTSGVVGMVLKNEYVDTKAEVKV